MTAHNCTFLRKTWGKRGTADRHGGESSTSVDSNQVTLDNLQPTMLPLYRSRCSTGNDVTYFFAFTVILRQQSGKEPSLKSCGPRRVHDVSDLDQTGRT